MQCFIQKTSMRLQKSPGSGDLKKEAPLNLLSALSRQSQKRVYAVVKRAEQEKWGC